MSGRRQFLATLGATSAAIAFGTDELRAEQGVPDQSGPWDTSWLDQLATARYRVVFNGSTMNDGEVMDYASTFLDHFHEAHGTADSETRPVIVFRRLGTSLAINDAIWEKYELGADSKTQDPATHAPARRNIYWRGSNPDSPSATSIETLRKRGLIALVCNIALGNIGRQLAQRTNQDVATVQTELKSNLVPGAILVPSGIYALIRAQNAGCAFMLGT